MTPIPTLTALYNGVLTDLQTQYGVTISLFGKVFLRATAAVQAGKLKLLYLYLGDVQTNIFADTSRPESKGGTLERQGRIKLGRNPFPAVAGQYQIQLSGSIGAVIGTVDAPATFKSDDDSVSPGFLFVLSPPYTMLTTSDTVIVRALTAGVESKLNIGDKLTATAPIANVNSSVYVLAESVQPLAAESVEVAYRAAILNRERLEPNGGADADYRLWSQDSPGVKIVYPYAKSGYTNEVDVFIEAFPADSVDGKGTPTAGIITTTEAVIDFDPDTSIVLEERGRRPTQVVVNCLPVTIKTVDIIITGYTGVTLAQQTLILNALTTMIANIRPFVAGADILTNKNDTIDTNKVIASILTQIPGAVFSSITIKINSVTLLSYQFIQGNIPYLNSVTYV